MNARERRKEILELRDRHGMSILLASAKSGDVHTFASVELEMRQAGVSGPEVTSLGRHLTSPAVFFCCRFCFLPTQFVADALMLQWISYNTNR